MNAKVSLSRRGAVLLVLALGIGAIGARILFEDDDAGPYLVDPTDWICGLGDPRQLTNPARVDYPSLMEATPAMRELKRDGVDPDSARGIILRSKAQSEVTHACGIVRRRFQHCSVWRKIERRDGGSIPDRTREALQEVEQPEPSPPPPTEFAASPGHG